MKRWLPLIFQLFSLIVLVQAFLYAIKFQMWQMTLMMFLAYMLSINARMLKLNNRVDDIEEGTECERPKSQL